MVVSTDNFVVQQVPGVVHAVVIIVVNTIYSSLGMLAQ